MNLVLSSSGLFGTSPSVFLWLNVSSLFLLSLSHCMSDHHCCECFFPHEAWAIPGDHLLLQEVRATTMAITHLLIPSGRTAISRDITRQPSVSSSPGVTCWVPGGPKLARHQPVVVFSQQDDDGRDLSDLSNQESLPLFITIVKWSFRNFLYVPCDNGSDDNLVRTTYTCWVSYLRVSLLSN